MALDFPSSPNVGDSFTSAGRVWQWDGVKWVPASTSGSGFLLDPPNDGQYYTRQTGLWVPEPTPSQGFVNKLRNGTFDVWQRGTGAISCASGSNTYVADGWIIYPNVTVTAGMGPGIAGGCIQSLQINGAAGATAVNVVQRIESAVATPLAGQRVTFQAMVANNTGATITPQLSSYYAGARDNWSVAPIADLSAVNLQSCPNGAITKVAYTWTVSGNAWQGYEIFLTLPVTAGNVQIAAADLRATPGLPVGLNNNPPPPELRPVATELAFCQRYLARWGNGLVGQGAYSSATIGTLSINYPTMRVSPTVTYGLNTGFTFAGLAATWNTFTGTTQFASVGMTVSGGTIGLPANLSVNAGNYLQLSAEL